MTATAPHCNPAGKTNIIDTWRERGRMAVPSSKGGILDLLIVAIYETTSVNGQPLDLLIDARKTSNDAVKQFGVVFSATPPDWSKYRIPVLWREDNASGVGRWK